MIKRRANHEGSIYKRQDGRWCASVTLPGGTRKSYYGPTRQAVAQKLTTGLKVVQEGLPVPSEHLKVGRYLQEWLTSTQSRVRESTWRRYEQLLRIYALPALGRLPLTRLEPRHVQRLYADCAAQGLKPATVRQLHTVLRRALGQAMKWGTVARNVVRLVEAPQKPHYAVTPLTAVQVRALLGAAQGTCLEALYVLALTTGMRVGELLGLRWRDVDLDGRALHIQHALARTREGLRLQAPKTARSWRRIALSPSAAVALRHHRSLQAQARLTAGPAWVDQDLVFPTRHGTPLDATHLVYQSFRPLLQAAGLPRIRFHDLRHTCATLLLQHGVHPKVVSELLGHSSIGMTLDIYSHVLPDMQAHAASAMERLLAP